MKTLGLLPNAFLLGVVAAAPLDVLSGFSIFGRQAPATPRALPPDEQKLYTQHAHFASAAYCPKEMIQNWSCGIDCKVANSPKFQYIAAGGDNRTTLPYYIGYDPADLTLSGSNNATGGTIVLSYQGTPGSNNVLDLLTGLASQLLKVNPKALTANGPNLFKSVPPGVNTHTGFADLHASTALEIQRSISKALKTYNTSKVLVTGHSLGAAVAVIAAASLKQNLPGGTTVSTIAFASPRVGNTAFANFAGNTISVIRHINNKQDFVPVIPGRTENDLPGSLLQDLVVSLGAYDRGRNNYSGVKGEIHIDQSGTWYDCGATLDNPNLLCSTGAVTSVGDAFLDGIIKEFFPGIGRGRLSAVVEPTVAAAPALDPNPILGANHNGPYNGVAMGTTCGRMA